MKIQKQLSKKRGDKVYHKYVVVLPGGVVKEAEFRGGQELEVKVKKGEIRLKRKVKNGAPRIG